MAVPPTVAVHAPLPLKQLGIRCIEALVKAVGEANSSDRNRLEDIAGRFKIWAGNIGLAASGMAGVEYRFRDDATATDVLESMLNSMQRRLLRLMDPTAIGIGDHEMNEHASDLSSEDDYELDADNTNNTNDTVDISNMSPIRAVEDIVDQLYQFLKLVKTTETAGEYSRVVNFSLRYAEDLEDPDYADFMRFSIRREVPNASPEVAERLLSAALYRRWKILYKQEHSKKLRGNIDNLFGAPGPSSAVNQINQPPVTDIAHLLEVPHLVVQDVTSAQRKVQIAAPTDTMASTVQKLSVPMPSRSVAHTQISASGITRRAQLDIPRPSSLNANITSHGEAVCPYCAQILRLDVVEDTVPGRAKWA